ncbi:MAG TPA: class I SAM-dependent DNA methyltransferase [Chthonomonadaceae bacterium]|nr:class I SAM-dependent DNA methyltransferase [Chthonomonadaceae bacterium]
MDQVQHSSLANFIWTIADDVLRDYYVRGKYRDVILPMTVIRRLDSMLEDTKPAVLAMNALLEDAGVVNREQALREAAGQAFYNTSPFRLRDLTGRSKQAQLRADFEAYLNGFSSNVQEILEMFSFYNQVPTLAKADLIGGLLSKFLDRSINLSPKPVLNEDGSVRLPGLDNHAMGTIFEELIRRFNEESNEEAGEHWTPRDVVTLMADLVLLPVADKIKSGSYHVYDGACGTGGMLTVAEQRLLELAKAHGAEAAIHLYGQEVNPETYAIAKADLLLKGEGADADNIRLNSTLSQDEYGASEFDFMLSNPPYGKSWKADLNRWDGKANITDPRFVIQHAGDPEFSLVTRSSDGQLMFLVNMLSKMKHKTALGSRIAEVHNGSSLFTGDAGQGESNIRRWILENDWLEAIIALPLNIFYNTGIATYIWVLSNRKPEHRRGRVQLIDGTGWFKPLRKNLGKKNCELSAEDRARVLDLFLRFEETEQSKIFRNEAFGYWKVTVERPLRLRVDLSPEALARFRSVCEEANDEPLAACVARVAEKLGPGPHDDYSAFLEAVAWDADHYHLKLPAKRLKLLQGALAVKDEAAAPVIKRLHRPGKAEADALHGLFPVARDGGPCVAEYEPDSDLRDTEQVPLLEPGGIEAFFCREVRPYVPDAWIDPAATRIGSEISFTRYFYKPQPLRTLEEIRADIEALERETEGLLSEVLVETECAP